MSDSPDVLVIGAGPAGSVAAAMLARKGYKVLVLERQQFPRFSIGESLLAYSTQMLSDAGLLEPVLSAGFQFKNGASFVYEEQHTEFNFADKFTPGYGFTFQVLRSKFDHLLANEAARLGATVRFGVEITAVDVSGAVPSVTSRTLEGGAIEVHRPRFVLDGSGFGRTLPRLLDLEKPSDFPVRAARFCHVKDGIVAGAFNRQKIRVGINPKERDIWSWLIPFPDGTSSLGIVASREQLARYTGTDEEKYWGMVADEPRLRALLKDAHTIRPVGEIIGFAANVKTLHGPGFALLGNAAEFLDPVFSSGVTIALHSAKLATDLLDRKFRGETVNWQTEFAEALLFGVETFRTFVNGWYDGSLQDVIFFPDKTPSIHRMICSVLAGYVWDPTNPYNGPQSARRLRALAATCRDATRQSGSCESHVTDAPAGHAITGVALANCLGVDNRTVFERAFAGVDSFSPGSAYFAFPFETALGILPALTVDPEVTCTPTRLAGVALASVVQLRPAVRAAVERWGGHRVAYVFASSTGGLEQTERALAPHPSLPAGAAYSYADHSIDATTAAITKSLGITGITMAVSTACSSSFKALASACRLIDRGLADAVVVGSADSLCRTTVFGFHSLGLTAPTATQPFGRDRCGITLGEGSAYVVLERETDATRRHAIARVAGLGAASDAFHHTSPHPEGLGGQLCMRQALDRAGITPNEIDCVSAHGTGTKLNDAAEAAAITRVFERRVPLTATKSLTGHTLGSAGLTSLVLAIESLRRQEIPATLRATPIDDALGMAVVDTLTPARLAHVLVNAFGFGGSNASVVVSQPRRS